MKRCVLYGSGWLQSVGCKPMAACLVILCLGLMSSHSVVDGAESSLQQRIAALFTAQLVPAMPRGATVTVRSSFPYRNSADPERDGLASQLSGLLLAETRAALTGLNIDIDSSAQNVGDDQRGLDPCRQPDLSRFVIAGEYQLVGDQVRVQYRICNRERVSERWPMLELPTSVLQGIALKPEPRPESVRLLTETTLVPPNESRAKAKPAGPAALPDLKVEVSPDRGDGAIYYLGETMQIRLWANRKCYVYLYHTNADGELQLLFPNYENPTNRLEANRVTVVGLPGTAKGSFEVTTPLGTEKLRLVATEERQFEDYHERMDTLTQSNPLWKETTVTRKSIELALTKGLRLRTGGSDVAEPQRLQAAPVRFSAEAFAGFTVQARRP